MIFTPLHDSTSPGLEREEAVSEIFCVRLIYKFDTILRSPITKTFELKKKLRLT